MEKMNNTSKNVLHTPLHPNCRLCHYAGYSNLCTFAQGGECPYISLRNSLNESA